MRIDRAGAALCALALSAVGLAAAAEPQTVKGPVILDTGAASIGAVPLAQSAATKPINISTGTTTILVDASSKPGFKTFVTHFDVIAAGTGKITFVYGAQTSTPCDTNQTALTGAYNLTAQAGISAGDGLGAVLNVPPGAQLCAVTDQAVQMSGSVSYVQLPTQQ